MLTVTLFLAAPAQAAEQFSRIYGQDRYQTALQIEQNSQQANNVVLAVGYNFPDALSAGTLAAKVNASVLLLGATPELSASTLEKAASIAGTSDHIYLVGGQGVIGRSFTQALTGLGVPGSNITQLGGSDRYETSALVAASETIPQGTPVFLATGDSYADALAVSSIAAKNGSPLLLVSRNTLPDSVRNYLLEEKPSSVTVISSAGSLTPNVIQSIKNTVSGQVNVVSSGSVYTTEAQLLTSYAPHPAAVYLATGLDYADALTGGALAIQNNGILLLVDPRSSLPQELTTYLTGQKASLTVIGGSGAIPDSLADNVSQILAGPATPQNPTLNSDASSNPLLNQETVASVTYPDSVGTLTKKYTWKFNHKTYTWSVDVDQSVLSADRDFSQAVSQFYTLDGSQQNQTLAKMTDNQRNLVLSVSTDGGDYTPWVKDSVNSAYANVLAQGLLATAKNDKFDAYQTANFFLSFVGNLPYAETSAPQFAEQTVIEGGDCKDTSILLAGMLEAAGYKVALIRFDPPAGETAGHMIVGVNLDQDQIPSGSTVSSYDYDGTTYYDAETTAPGYKIGDDGGFSDDLEDNGYVYPLN